MSGEIRRLLDRIIAERSKGDRIAANITVTKLVLKGLDPERYTPTSPDDPATLERVRAVARDMGVQLERRAQPAVASSKAPTVAAAVDALAASWGTIEPQMIVTFASQRYDHEALARAITARYPSAQQLGCTSSGEIAMAGLLRGSVAAMALPSELVANVKVALVDDLNDPVPAVKRAFATFGAHFGRPVAELERDRYVGLVLVDGLSLGEERLMEALGDATDVMFVGGSAADDTKSQRTVVSANGRTSSGAAALALLEPRVPFSVLKTQSVRELPRQLVATRVDEASRRVLEFDGRPALEAYAEAVGAGSADLDAHYARHPLGLMVQGEPYVRSPMRAEGSSLYFYCRIKEGTRLSLLESTDIVEETRMAVATRRAQLGGFSGVIHFNCVQRWAELERRGQTEAFAQLFEEPTVGLGTFGEQLIGHVNQTSTMLAFGRAKA